MQLRRFVALSCALMFVVAVSAVPAAAEQRDSDTPPDYLALGDSVPFGYNPLIVPSNPDVFVGYPELLAPRLEMRLSNAACPGETSGSFISLTAPDNGCRFFRFFLNLPLHVSYTTVQLDYALAFLESHPRTRLVTLMVGANDLFLLDDSCAGAEACILAGLPGMLTTLSANLGTIYGRIRTQAKYHHQLIGVTYYTVDYTDLVTVQVVQALNTVIAQRTRAAGGDIADGFTAFKSAAAPFGGNACAAGLLVVKSTTPLTCDVHPSLHGQQVLANAVARVVEDDDR